MDTTARLPRLAVLPLSLLVLSLSLAGCALQQTAPPATISGAALNGHVHGGNQPVSYSTLQLYAAATTGYASASLALIPSGSYYLGGAPGCVASSSQTCYPAVESDAHGGFTLTGDYTCPSASSQVYLVATGGNPGLSTGTNNSTLAMMAALGSCGNLTGTTPITINEVTTVAAVWALAPFMSGYANVGTSSTNTAGLAQAVTNAGVLVNIADGTVKSGTITGSNFWTLSLPTSTIKASETSSPPASTRTAAPSLEAHAEV